MVLNVKTGELNEGNYFTKTYWLTPTQTRLLRLLSDNKTHTIKEIEERLSMNEKYVRTTLCRLRKRVKNLCIETYIGFGIRLEDVVKIKEE